MEVQEMEKKEQDAMSGYERRFHPTEPPQNRAEEVLELTIQLIISVFEATEKANVNGCRRWSDGKQQSQNHK
jgi:hypothetical protein